jgi:glutamate 5-kinase
MRTKYKVAVRAADEGIAVVIANGKRDNILTDVIAHPDTTICTRFLPAAVHASSVKKWIAHSEDFAKGALYLNAQAAQVVRSGAAVSILPVGVTRIEGAFEKDDIVRILDDDGTQLGVGRIGYHSDQARNLLGQHGRRPLIHYDYLYLD